MLKRKTVTDFNRYLGTNILFVGAHLFYKKYRVDVHIV